MMNNPENLPKSRLIEELRKRGVQHSPSKSKDYYVSLYKKHFERRSIRQRRSEFSSDDDALARSQDKTPPREKRYSKVLDIDHYLRQIKPISDTELLRQLRAHRQDPGPITGSTRGLYEKKLARVLAEKAKGGVAKSSSVITIASESDEEEDLSSGGEEVDSPPRPSPSYSRQVRQSTVVKRVVKSSPMVTSSYQLRSSKPRPRPVQQQEIVTQVGEYEDDDVATDTMVEPRPSTAGSVMCSGWVWLQFVLLLIAFIAGLIVFDYLRYGNSRLVTWINAQLAMPPSSPE